jgi:hypothetical protein
VEGLPTIKELSVFAKCPVLTTVQLGHTLTIDNR